MASTPKQKFDAAVGVIQGLPKNGSFQPSHELMLRFYAYYKQATLGPCKQSKPSFWEVVKKAKWDAWNGLGNMPCEEAMIKYVEELKQIIETMPQTDEVADFIETLGSFYEIVEDKRDTSEKYDKAKVEMSEKESDVANVDAYLDQSETHEVSVSSTPSEGGSDEDVNSQLLNAVVQSELNAEPYPEEVIATEEDSQLNSTGHDPSLGLNNGNDGTVDEGSESDESEEFCYTTEPDDQQVPRLVPVSSTSVSTPIKSLDKVDHAYRAISTPEEVASLTISPIKCNDLKDRPGRDRRDVPIRNIRTVDQIDSHIRHGVAPYVNGHYPLVNGSGSRHSDYWRLETDGAIGIQSRGGGESSSAPSGGHDGQLRERNAGVNRQGLAVPPSQQSAGQHLLAGSSGGHNGRTGGDVVYDSHTSQQIMVALLKLQQDMDNVLTRLDTLETLTTGQSGLRTRDGQGSQRIQQRPEEQTTWWPFQNISPTTVLALTVWPFIAHWLMQFLTRPRNRRGRP